LAVGNNWTAWDGATGIIKELDGAGFISGPKFAAVDETLATLALHPEAG